MSDAHVEEQRAAATGMPTAAVISVPAPEQAKTGEEKKKEEEEAKAKQEEFNREMEKVGKDMEKGMEAAATGAKCAAGLCCLLCIGIPCLIIIVIVIIIVVVVNGASDDADEIAADLNASFDAAQVDVNADGMRRLLKALGKGI